MNRQQFLDYIEAYNTGDLATVASHYTDDVIFENFGRHHQGAEVLHFLTQLHQGMRDRITPRCVLVDGDQIAMEADVEIEALVDLPSLPAGAMHAGERRTIRMFAFYDLQGQQIRHIRIAGWPAAA